MAQHVIETVTFQLNAGVTRDAFADAAKAVNRYVTGCVGFVSRRLSCAEDGTWIEHIEWESMAAAKAAAAGIGKEPGNAPFLQAIDGSSARLVHSDLVVTVDR